MDRIVAALERYLDHTAQRWRWRLRESRSVGSVAAVWALRQRLGLNNWFTGVGAARGAKRLSDAVFAMVANRLIDRCSKRRVPEWASPDVIMPSGWTTPELQQLTDQRGGDRIRSSGGLFQYDESGTILGTVSSLALMRRLQ